MLEKVDLDKKMKRKEWKALRPELQQRLYDLEKACYAAGMPVIIVFEGWDAAGKGTCIQQLTQRLDPRGFKVWPIRAARTFEKNHPWLWRFWLKLPNDGEIAIFDRSWYGRVLVERVDGLIPADEWNKGYRDIVDFERMLADDGHVIIKFWLHISKAEQAKRFKMLEKDPLLAWHVQAEDWEHHWRYKDYLRAAEEMFERTETEWGPWTIVEATDEEYTRWKVLNTICEALAAGLRARGIDPERLSEEAVNRAAAAGQPVAGQPGAAPAIAATGVPESAVVTATPAPAAAPDATAVQPARSPDQGSNNGGRDDASGEQAGSTPG